ncbi:MAG: helix-turn-helix transcriptional regulator [Quinella sp. 1Q7]|nr:helix-turn-helix transcriptional regulator [Quinella sp. 1Q7]
MTDGGEGASGLIHTPEHNARIGLANRGQKRSDESRARMSKARTLIAERAYSPYVTLVALLAERVISYTELAKAVGITQEGMSYKMCGKHQFSLVQMEIIRTYLGVVDMTLEELFRREDGSVPDMTPKPYVYPVLAAILQKKRVTFKRLAKVLGVDKSTVSYKMRGKSEFTPEQKAAIRDFLQVDTPLEELFKRQ